MMILDKFTEGVTIDSKKDQGLNPGNSELRDQGREKEPVNGIMKKQPVPLEET